jgi:hypothetical protein
VIVDDDQHPVSTLRFEAAYYLGEERVLDVEDPAAEKNGKSKRYGEPVVVSFLAARLTHLRPLGHGGIGRSGSKSIATLFRPIP